MLAIAEIWSSFRDSSGRQHFGGDAVAGELAIVEHVLELGPYGIVRHPGYTGVLLVVVGSGVVSGNWVGLAAWTLLVLLPLLYRIHVEENPLLAARGDAYRSYASHHKRLIPLIW
jgi:protein-S-isoprenylcysteine O-methyltransferase Ste14